MLFGIHLRSELLVFSASLLCLVLQAAVAASPARAQQCTLTAAPSQGVLESGRKQKTFVKIGVTGFEMKSEEKRTPLNVALVLDRSGSMSGSKIRQAKDAARCVVEQMGENDILSLITYSDEATVVVPATKMANREEVLKKIDELEAGGMTALHAGTQQGLSEVKKFFDKDRVNRVVLLSDGLANVGPSETSDLAALGKEAGQQGIAVTTFGLGQGYNEDLMLALASSSDGNHVFITTDSNLPEVFNEEFRFATKVVAQEVKGTFTPDEKVKVLRCLNREVELGEKEVAFAWNQLYSGHERYLILEVEIPACDSGEELVLGTAKLHYRNMATEATDELSAVARVRFSDSREEREKSIDKEVTRDAAMQVANLDNIRAMKLRDAGEISKAKSVLEGNRIFLRETAEQVGGDEKLEAAAALNSDQAGSIESDQTWMAGRKAMRANQGSINSQSITAPVK